MIDNIAFSQTNPSANSPRTSPSAAGEMTNVNNEMNALEDTIFQGYVQEAATIARLANNSFSTTGNTTAFYTAGRRLRLNRAGTPIYLTVASSSFNGVITTITTQETTVPNPITTVDLSIQPKGNTNPTSYSQTFESPTLHNPTITGTVTGISINRAFTFPAVGVPSVGSDISPLNPVSPENVTAIKLWAYCKTAPTGSAVIFHIFNITQNKIVGTITINQAAQTANTTVFSNAAIVAGDTLRLDMTQADTNGVGAGYSFTLECSQP